MLTASPPLHWAIYGPNAKFAVTANGSMGVPDLAKIPNTNSSLGYARLGITARSACEFWARFSARQMEPNSPTLSRGCGQIATKAGKARVMSFGNLLHWAIIFLVVALVAALLGFGGVAGTAMEGAKILFYVAIVIAVIFFLLNVMRGRA
jgi:uncharacterized membrane protein YtjA (UPF0391 family)